MKKIHILLFGMLILPLLWASCNKTPTYMDRLKDESKAINRFISRNNLVILDEYPSNGVFRENEFYRDPYSGVYYNIIDPGNSNIKVEQGSEINIRYKGLTYFMTDDTTKYTNDNPVTSPWPQTITFQGQLNSVTRSYYTSSVPGLIAPAQHLGEGGKAKLIVPFNMGSQYDRTNYQPTYYEEIRYTRIHKPTK